MLILTRKPDERIVITNKETGDVITVLIAKVEGDRVTVGIEAPRHIEVLREEISLRRAGNPEATHRDSIIDTTPNVN